MVGHALPELMLVPGLYPVGKCLVVMQEPGADDAATVEVAAVEAAAVEATAVEAATAAIAAGHVLCDPAELRPLPLPGIPGWHPGQTAAFYAQTPCFRPLREGRVYPEPLRG